MEESTKLYHAGSGTCGHESVTKPLFRIGSGRAERTRAASTGRHAACRHRTTTPAAQRRKALAGCTRGASYLAQPLAGLRRCRRARRVALGGQRHQPRRGWRTHGALRARWLPIRDLRAACNGLVSVRSGDASALTLHAARSARDHCISALPRLCGPRSPPCCRHGPDVRRASASTLELCVRKCRRDPPERLPLSRIRGPRPGRLRL